MKNQEDLFTGFDISFFKKDLEEYEIRLDEKQIHQFIRYYELLTEWNAFMNLTAITDFHDVVKKHFVDSLSMVGVVDNFLKRTILKKGCSVIDVGTGAGFPGIPLKILFPDIRVTLLDSLQKRVKFLDTVIQELGLVDICTIHSRAEDAARDDSLREKFDVCVSRAVANLSTLCEYCIPFCKVGGMFVSYKSEKLSEELSSGKKAVSLLGGSIKEIKEFMLPDSEIKRVFLVVEKKKKTPFKFPRKAGLPSKDPLC